MLSCNLKEANLRSADLEDAVLMIANLVSADLCLAGLTGTKLYGTARDEWKIDGIKCDYAYWDGSGKVRTPQRRSYRPGEFEQLYSQLPTIEYLFENVFSPLTVLIMDRVIRSINEQRPDFELNLDSYIIRGIPRAVFSVLHKKDCDQALEMIRTQYKDQMHLVKGELETASVCNEG